MRKVPGPGPVSGSAERGGVGERVRGETHLDKGELRFKPTYTVR